jgi:hypothetical protein
MSGADKWIWCGLVGIMGVLGLYVASRGGPAEAVAYFGGLLFFAFCVLFILYHVNSALDKSTKRDHQHRAH